MRTRKIGMFVSNKRTMYYLLKPLEDLFVWSFGIMENLGNIPNDIFLVFGFVMMFYWLNLQRKYNNDKKTHPYG